LIPAAVAAGEVRGGRLLQSARLGL